MMLLSVHVLTQSRSQSDNRQQKATTYKKAECVKDHTSSKSEKNFRRKRRKRGNQKLQQRRKRERAKERYADKVKAEKNRSDEQKQSKKMYNQKNYQKNADKKKELLQIKYNNDMDFKTERLNAEKKHIKKVF